MYKHTWKEHTKQETTKHYHDNLNRHAPWEIFKYLPMYGSEFLRNQSLRISTPEALNDPFEFNKAPAQILKDISEGFDPSLSNHLFGHGVISFSKIADSIPMWSYYAESHKGVAYGFDARHDFFNDLYDVKYLRTRPNDIKDYAELISLKSDQWIFEREVRLFFYVYHDADKVFVQDDMGEIKVEPIPTSTEMEFPPNKDKMFMKEVPFDAITSVTFGDKCDSDTRKKMHNLIVQDKNLSHISVFEARRDHSSWDVKIQKYAHTC